MIVPGGSPDRLRADIDIEVDFDLCGSGLCKGASRQEKT